MGEEVRSPTTSARLPFCALDAIGISPLASLSASLLA
jgi:hypothetical protein